MTTTGLEVFDKTMHTANLWLKEINEEIGPDRQLAWRVLGVGLRALRDRVPADDAAHLGAELPLIIRGAYYDQYRPSAQPKVVRSREAFLAQIADGLGDVRPVDPETAARAVFGVLTRHMPEGQIAKTRNALPKELRTMWPNADGAAAG